MVPGYKANLPRLLEKLNQALATELVCVLRYRRHYEMAKGVHSESVAEEFLEHANEEQEHANQLARRIAQLNGEPNFNPEGLLERSHTQYRECSSLAEMVRENLIAERIAVEKYSELIREIGNDDPTTRKLVESILEKEEEHADDLAKIYSSYSAQDHSTNPTAHAGPGIGLAGEL